MKKGLKSAYGYAANDGIQICFPIYATVKEGLSDRWTRGALNRVKIITINKNSKSKKVSR